jgi:hypothetical protein
MIDIIKSSRYINDITEDIIGDKSEMAGLVDIKLIYIYIYTA